MINLRKHSVTLITLVTAFLVSVASISAEISTFKGNISGGEPQSFEVDDGSCTVIETILHPYEAYPSYVTISGLYQYTDLSISYALDMQLTIYTTSYDPNNVLTNCVTRFDDSGTVNLVAGQQYIFVVQPLFDSDTGDWEFEMDGPGEVIFGTLSSPAVVDGVTESVFIPLDERINRYDSAAPIAVYPNSDGGVDIYTIDNDTSEGSFLFRIEVLSDASCDNSLIESKAGVAIYRDIGCTYQINAPQYNGKTYVLRFNDVSSTAHNTLAMKSNPYETSTMMRRRGKSGLPPIFKSLLLYSIGCKKKTE